MTDVPRLNEQLCCFSVFSLLLSFWLKSFNDPFSLRHINRWILPVQNKENATEELLKF